MIAIITGDIINSRALKNQKNWTGTLKEALAQFGEEHVQWEIYRGDSFQLETTPCEALRTAIYIKACLKTLKNADVRMSIGIGAKSYAAKSVGESNGEAFELSGLKFETLKKEKISLAIQTKDTDLNKELNLLIKLSLIAMDNWSIGSAIYVKTALENENSGQAEIGEILGINQPSVSERHTRAYFSEMQELMSYVQSKINEYISS